MGLLNGWLGGWCCGRFWVFGILLSFVRRKEIQHCLGAGSSGLRKRVEHYRTHTFDLEGMEQEGLYIGTDSKKIEHRLDFLGNRMHGEGAGPAGD